MEQKSEFNHYCLVELMGHQRIVGKVTEEAMFGSALMRVDVPKVEDGTVITDYTRYFGGSAIYSITPITESVAVELAKSVRAPEVVVYVPPSRQLSGSSEEDFDFE